MKVVFLVFSPSGNGRWITGRLGSLLAAKKIESHVVESDWQRELVPQRAVG